MEIWVDADGCPVIRETVALAAEYHIPVTLVADTAHQLDVPGARTILVDAGPDSADFVLVNRLRPGDLVITQDYGLAALCLSRGALVLRQDGLSYHSGNIDALLDLRAVSARIRRGGGRLKGPKPRTKEMDAAFSAALRTLLEEAG